MTKIAKNVQCALALAVLVLFGLGITAGKMMAQTTTQGSITGTVLDATGAIVPNATIKIVNNATNATAVLSAGASGDFAAPLLEPGDYTVTVTAPGFGTFRADHVIVQVGQATQVSTKLTAGAATSVVEVTADVPVMNYESASFSSNVNLVELQNIPINNRRWSALALTTPGVTVDTSGFGLVSVRGISTILNNVEIDGADDNQAFFSEERGRTREAYSTSGSAVREFAMNTGVYPAEYGRAAGGVINSVTKSGTNNLHGEAYFWDRESNWGAISTESVITKLVNGVNVTSPIKGEDLRKIYGFTAGGPLIKNKLFWIYTYDQHTHVFPLVGVPASPAAFYEAPDVLGSAGDAACNADGFLNPTGLTIAAANSLDQQVCTLAARLSKSGMTKYGTAVTYSDALALYNSGVTALNNDLGLIPRFGYQEINTPKLDWQINDKEHVSILFHRLRWDSPGGVQTTSPAKYSLDSAGTDFVKLDYGVAKLISQISTHVSNELLYQYGRELNDEGKQPITSYDTTYMVTSDGNDPYNALDVSNIGFYVGMPYYSFRPAYPEEWKWQIGDDLYYERGKHNFKFGVDMVHNSDLENQSQYYEGYFQYTTNLTNYLADLYSRGYATGTCNSSVSSYSTSATTNATGAYPCWNKFEEGYGPTSFAFSTMDQGYFAQDDWKATPRLSLQLGVRYDYEGLPPASPALTAASGTYVPFTGVTNDPSDKENFGPRVGFAYDVFGKGKTVLHGGYGVYYGRITNGNEGYALQDTGSPLAQTVPNISVATSLAADPIWPNRFSTSQETSSVKPAAYFRGNNLKTPQVQEFDLMVQEAIGKGTVVQVGYLGSLGRRLPNFLDVNLNPATTESLTYSVVPASGTTNYGPLGNTTVTIPVVYTSYGNANVFGTNGTNFQSITELVSNINSNYSALSVEVQNRSLHAIQFDANYTWAHALDYSQNASTAGNTNGWYDPYQNYRANYGNSTWDIRDRFNAYLVYNFPNLKTQSVVKYVTNDWKIDTSFQMQTGLPFSAAANTSSAPGGISSYVNGSDGSSLIPGLGINTQFQSRVIVDDLRLEKDIPFESRFTLQLMGQAFNLANHENETEVYGTAYNIGGTTTAPTLTYQPTWGQTEQWNNSGFTYTPREIELTARLTF